MRHDRRRCPETDTKDLLSRLSTETLHHRETELVLYAACPKSSESVEKLGSGSRISFCWTTIRVKQDVQEERHR